MPIYSHSRLSCFENCPLKFKFNYIDKFENIEEGVEAFLGSRVHETLEKLYRDLRFMKENSLKDLLKFFNDEWKKRWHKNVIIVRKGYVQENYLRMGEKYIKDYYNEYEPFDQSKTIAIEKRIVIKLDVGGKFKLQGFIDRLSFNERDGCYEIHDYKTNFNLPIQEYLDEDRQLALYQLAVKGMYSDAKKVKLVWHFLAFNKEMSSERSAKQLEALRKDTIALIKKIEKHVKEEDFKAKVTKLCDWCEFKRMCPKWKHLFGLEEKSVNDYLKEEGVVLVNKYAEFSLKMRQLKKEIEEELEKLKEALVKYAEKKEIDMIYGSNHKINVKVSDSIKFPGKNEEDRKKLNEILKQIGKWEEVSELNIWALAKIVQGKTWPKETLKKIKKYSKLEKSERLFLSKFKKEK